MDPTYGEISDLIKVSPTSSLVTYTPDPNFPFRTSKGIDMFEFKVIDTARFPEVSLPATVYVTVSDIIPKVEESITLRTEENSPVTLTLTVLDPDISNGDHAKFTITKPPKFGTVDSIYPRSISPDSATITYTPFYSFNGIDNFSFKAHDSSNLWSNTGKVLINVNANNPPNAVDDRIYVKVVNNTSSIPLSHLLANDIDVDPKDRLTVIMFSPKSFYNGTLSLNPDGSKILYTLPSSSYNGTDGFFYTISDGVNIPNHNSTAIAYVRVIGNSNGITNSQ